MIGRHLADGVGGLVRSGGRSLLQVSPLLVLITIVAAVALGWALAFEDWFTVVAVVLISISPILIRWPVISTFAVYAFLIPFDSVAALAVAGGATVTRFVGLISATVMLAVALVHRDRLVRPPSAAIWWTLLVIWGVVSAAWAVEPDAVFGRLRTVLSLLFFYLVAVSFRVTRKELFTVCTCAVTGAVIAAAFSYASTDTASVSARGTLTLAQKTANPNELAGTLILPLALAIGGLISLRRLIWRVAAMAAIVVIAAGIYATASRKALLAIAAVVLVLLYRTRVRWQILAAVVLLIAVIGTAPQVFTDRVESIISGQDSTGAGRTDIWSVGLTALKDFWVFGAGLENYTVVYGRYASTALGIGAHNTYLAISVELGILGLLLLLGAIGSHMLAAFRCRARPPYGITLWCIEAAGYGMIITAFFGDWLWGKDFWLLWVVMTWAVRAASERPVTAASTRELPRPAPHTFTPLESSRSVR